MGSSIDGATTSTLLVTPDLQGKQVRVLVRTFDADGNPTPWAASGYVPIRAPQARINVGGPEVNTSGITWTADDPALWTGGTVHDYGTATVAGTADDVLYRTQRFGPTGGAMTRHLPLADGYYVISVLFAEQTPQYQNVGARVFDVTAAGALWDDVDVWNFVEGYTALRLERNVVVSGGAGVNLTFTAPTKEAFVNAIEVRSGADAVPDPTPVPHVLTAAGDVDTPGVENFGPDALWVGTGSRVGGATATVSGATVPGAFEKWGPFTVTQTSEQRVPRRHAVSGRPWATELVPINSGVGYLKGHEWWCQPPNTTFPVDAEGREFGYYRFVWQAPNNFLAQGDMKLPDISGWKNRNFSYSPSGTGSGSSGSFSAGMMTGLGTAGLIGSGGKLHLKHYINADLGPGTFSAPAAGRNYWAKVKTSPTSSTDLTLPTGTGVDVEFVLFVRCNRANQRDGIFRLWVQPAGQARVLRSDFTDMQWVTSGASGLFHKFRSFWGGGTSHRPRYPNFNGPETAQDEAPHFRDFWIGSALPPIARS